MNHIYSLGHSTRSLEEFLALLGEHEIELVADVRRFPGSRRHPHFGREALAGSLSEQKIGYQHFEGLGGHRRVLSGSFNNGWETASFRAYADHMGTDEFGNALAELTRAATDRRTAYLCAEAVPWRCHRNLLSDALIAAGWEVIHILGPRSTRRHELNPMAARRSDGSLVYPGPENPTRQLDLL